MERSSLPSDLSSFAQFVELSNRRVDASARLHDSKELRRRAQFVKELAAGPDVEWECVCPRSSTAGQPADLLFAGLFAGFHMCAVAERSGTVVVESLAPSACEWQRRGGGDAVKRMGLRLAAEGPLEGLAALARGDFAPAVDLRSDPLVADRVFTEFVCASVSAALKMGVPLSALEASLSLLLPPVSAGRRFLRWAPRSTFDQHLASVLIEAGGGSSALVLTEARLLWAPAVTRAMMVSDGGFVWDGFPPDIGALSDAACMDTLQTVSPNLCDSRRAARKAIDRVLDLRPLLARSLVHLPPRQALACVVNADISTREVWRVARSWSFVSDPVPRSLEGLGGGDLKTFDALFSVAEAGRAASVQGAKTRRSEVEKDRQDGKRTRGWRKTRRGKRGGQKQRRRRSPASQKKSEGAAETETRGTREDGISRKPSFRPRLFDERESPSPSPSPSLSLSLSSSSHPSSCSPLPGPVARLRKASRAPLDDSKWVATALERAAARGNADAVRRVVRESTCALDSLSKGPSLRAAALSLNLEALDAVANETGGWSLLSPGDVLMALFCSPPAWRFTAPARAFLFVCRRTAPLVSVQEASRATEGGGKEGGGKEGVVRRWGPCSASLWNWLPGDYARFFAEVAVPAAEDVFGARLVGDRVDMAINSPADVAVGQAVDALCAALLVLAGDGAGARWIWRARFSGSGDASRKLKRFLAQVGLAELPAPAHAVEEMRGKGERECAEVLV